ncbi:MAG: hypothetical protein K6E73_11520 [Bacteroidales bacterium]|nr:hypothetical protein [Bacteroidales bacterium]
MQQRILISGSDAIGQERKFDTQLLYFTCSSLSSDDRYLYLMSDRDFASPNVFVHDLHTGEERRITDNHCGTLKSYVYFDQTPGHGLGKASVCLDPQRNRVFYVQDDKVMTAGLNEAPRVLNTLPADRVTAFTHVSACGRYLCVPMTDARILDYDPATEGAGLDRRPTYNIDGRAQREHLNSYLCVYDTASGTLLYEKRIPHCWITHVQFNPQNPDLIMYNNEWPETNCGIRRIWLYDHSTDSYAQVRTMGDGTLGNPAGYPRRAEDWVCHEMWSDDGRIIIYHGGYADGPAMVGRYSLDTRQFWEIALPADYNAYGHFTMDHAQVLCCDGYFKFPDDVKPVFDNSTDKGPDPHKKDGEYISRVVPDWQHGTLQWIPLCKHRSDWLGQDAHPHPIYSHRGDRIFFNARNKRDVKVYCVEVEQ